LSDTLLLSTVLCVALALFYRFVFKQTWAWSIGIALFAAAFSVVFNVWLSRRKRARAAPPPATRRRR